MAELLSSLAVAKALSTVPEWRLSGTEITRQFRLADFAAAMRFVNAVADLAEAANHHPDIDIRWNRVSLRLSTHSRGGLTDLDFALAARIDALAA